MAKVKTNKKYSYDYPENRLIAKGLVKGDQSFIARTTGYSLTHINDIFRGKRKMVNNVKQIAVGLTEINKQREKLVK
jgi:hypothetical protein